MHVNLLSPSLRARRLIRRHSRLWIAIAFTAVAGLSAWGFMELETEREFRAKSDAFERRFAPLASMRDDVELLAETRDNLRQRERFALVLSRERPLLSLLGTVSQAAKMSNGEVFVRELTYRGESQPGRASKQPRGRAGEPSLLVRGVGSTNLDIARFAAHLRDSRLFGNVELTASASVETTERARRVFQLNCSMNPGAEQ